MKIDLDVLYNLAMEHGYTITFHPKLGLSVRGPMKKVEDVLRSFTLVEMASYVEGVDDAGNPVILKSRELHPKVEPNRFPTVDPQQEARRQEECAQAWKAFAKELVDDPEHSFGKFHLRPDGVPCNYLAVDRCRKCGWLRDHKNSGDKQQPG